MHTHARTQHVRPASPSIRDRRDHAVAVRDQAHRARDAAGGKASALLSRVQVPLRMAEEHRRQPQREHPTEAPILQIQDQEARQPNRRGDLRGAIQATQPGQKRGRAAGGAAGKGAHSGQHPISTSNPINVRDRTHARTHAPHACLHVRPPARTVRTVRWY